MPFRIHRTAQGGYYLLPCTPVKTRRSKRSCRWALLTATMATAGMLLLLVMWLRFSSEPLTNKRIDDVYTALGEPGRKRLGAEILTVHKYVTLRAQGNLTALQKTQMAEQYLVAEGVWKRTEASLVEAVRERMVLPFGASEMLHPRSVCWIIESMLMDADEPLRKDQLAACQALADSYESNVVDILDKSRCEPPGYVMNTCWVGAMRTQLTLRKPFFDSLPALLSPAQSLRLGLDAPGGIRIIDKRHALITHTLTPLLNLANHVTFVNDINACHTYFAEFFDRDSRDHCIAQYCASSQRYAVGADDILDTAESIAVLDQLDHMYHCLRTGQDGEPELPNARIVIPLQ